MLFSRPNTTPIVEDEVYWIGSAYYYDLAFVQHDWRSSDWDLLPARENPPIAKYAIGLSLALSGQQVSSIDLLGSFYAMFESVPHAWGEGLDHAKREHVVERMNLELRQQIKRSGQISLDPALLISARRAMIVCVILTSLLVFLFGLTLGHGVVGIIASQLLLIHPAVVEAYNHAESDAIALLFSTAAAWVSFIFLRQFFSFDHTRPKKIVLLSFATGVLLALACGAKMNSLVVVLLFGSAILALIVRTLQIRGRSTIVPLLGYGTATLLCAATVFVLSNPAILHDPFGGIVACFQEHRLTERIQATFLNDHLVSLGDKFSAVTSLTYLGLFGFGLFVAIAIICCVARSSRTMRFVTWWWLLAFVCVTVWIPFPRTRYVLPLVVPSVLMIAYASVCIFGYLTTRIKAATRSRPPSAVVTH